MEFERLPALWARALRFELRVGGAANWRLNFERRPHSMIWASQCEARIAGKENGEWHEESRGLVWSPYVLA